MSQAKKKAAAPAKIFVGATADKTPLAQGLNLKLANRHGLIAGATGTGKTVTLQILAEGFSQAGVPVFLADVKGDLSGLSQAGKPNPKLSERAQTIGLDDYSMDAAPVVFWDLFGKQGHPIRTTVSEMGPLLLARLLELNDTQEGVLSVAFQLADDDGLLLLDLKDLRSLLNFVGENSAEIGIKYGRVSRASIGAIQRRLLTLQQQGGGKFFGEPALKLQDFMTRTAGRGRTHSRGTVNILAADKLMMSPRLYATFLLWLLAELFEELPEVGDPDKPKLVFFFDEAHLLFNDAPKALIEKVEQVVRLIRSKGVGVYFVTQSPLDIPDAILGQLGNRFQHALRAFTPRDQKAVKAAAETFRPNPKFKAAAAIKELGLGEALVSTLQGKGAPSVVQRTLIRPPASRLGPAKPAERRAVIAASPLAGVYDETLDRRSAHEILTERAEKAVKAAEKAAREKEKEKQGKSAKTASSRSSSSSRRQSGTEAFTSSLLRKIGYALGGAIVRGILGALKKGK
ncbi:MAG: helicase HerA-like domain-containing protein [Pseudomonadota bacterium]